MAILKKQPKQATGRAPDVANVAWGLARPVGLFWGRHPCPTEVPTTLAALVCSRYGVQASPQLRQNIRNPLL